MSLCKECSKNLLQKEEVKLKDNSIVCNKCAYDILREHYAEWYRKHPEKDFGDGPPKEERPISEEFEFWEKACVYCLESIPENSKEKVAISEAVAYGKCKGKKCPDCGKIRQEIHIKMKVFKNGFIGSWINCPQCKRREGCTLNGVCWSCFYKNEAKKGCICFNTRCKLWEYFCPLCEEVHILDFKCEKCVEKTSKLHQEKVRTQVSAHKKSFEIPQGKKWWKEYSFLVPVIVVSILLLVSRILALFLWKKRRK